MKNKKAQSSGTILGVALSIILFWLAINAALAFLQMNQLVGFKENDLEFSNTGANVNTVSKFFNIFIKTITFDIPNINPVFRFFFIFLEIISFVVVVFLIATFISMLPR